jgi:dihydroxyacid dehydratase/phosphogluconate dehydratase
MKSKGLSPTTSSGRPVIGFANSWSQLIPSNVHLGLVAQALARGPGARQVPARVPTTSLGETLVRPPNDALPQTL